MINWFNKRREKQTKSYESNAEWVKLLSAPADETAIADLRQILVRGLKPALYRYVVDYELDQFVEDVVQDALLKILENVGTFRDESKFVSWAMKIAVREGLSELRKKKWDDVSINDIENTNSFKYGNRTPGEQFETSNPNPERSAHENIVLSKVIEIINKELTLKQKKAIMAIKVRGMPVSVVARQMGIERNALYKLVHDARLNLKKKMKESGMDPENILNDL